MGVKEIVEREERGNCSQDIMYERRIHYFLLKKIFFNFKSMAKS